MQIDTAGTDRYVPVVNARTHLCEIVVRAEADSTVVCDCCECDAWCTDCVAIYINKRLLPVLEDELALLLRLRKYHVTAQTISRTELTLLVVLTSLLRTLCLSFLMQCILICHSLSFVLFTHMLLFVTARTTR